MELSEQSVDQIRMHLLTKGYIDDFRTMTKDGIPYRFQYYSPQRQISVELYPEKKKNEIRISLEYDQLYFLVEYHIKLIHREFPNVTIQTAYAIGNFLPRGVEYARIHGGMQTLTLGEALGRITMFG